MIRVSLSAGIFLGAVLLAAQPTPPDFLLPKDVVPRKHIIEMTIDPSQDTFTGVARIEVQVLKPVSVIWVNGRDLTVQEASIEIGKKAQKVKGEALGGEFIALEADKPVPAGRAVLTIRYQAPLSDSDKVNSGPFRRKVENDWYMFTVFTPIDARRAFPCFDEPGYKTPWEMSIRVKSTDKAFANGPVDRVTDEPNGMKLFHFAVTQPLPAEVVAFAAGPFDEYDGGTAGAKGTPIHVITPKGHGAEGKGAATVTQEILPPLEKYTGIPYPFTKLYHIYVPGGAFGATENPGLITYTRGLLIPPGTETPERLRGLKGTQTHEVGHQWFGDMVTQSTWEDVYLSEGFATWITSKMQDQAGPTARKHLSAVAARERIMATDAGPRTHPVRFTMKSRSDLNNVYNQIAYQKGAAILLMLDGWLGEDHVQKGVQIYLKAHAYGNAGTDDLAAALRKGSGTDPSAVMHSFLDQAGMPNVHAEVQCESGKAPRVVLEQTHSELKWKIPVCWSGDGIKPTCTVLDAPRREVALANGASCPAWIYPNAGGTGYWRSEWTPAQLTSLAVDKLSAAERLTLVYDLRAQQKAGRLDAAATQPILTRLTSDAEPEIIQAAKIALGLIPEPAGRGR